MRARGEPVAGIGPALGFRELKWLKPVYAGDTIEYTSEVIEMRLSDSRPRARADDVPLDRHQPERRAGDLVRQHHFRRTPRDDAMTAASRKPRTERPTSGARSASPAARMRCTTAIPT